MTWPSLILVNGPSSAGKTTLCRALQTAIEHPYLVVGFDDFIFMSAPRYYRGADTAQQSETDKWTALGAEMVRTSPPGAPVSVTARIGPVFRHLLDAMAPAVRTQIDRGNPVIFDHVLHDRSMYESYLAASAGLDVFTVGVTCPLDVLETRERARGDRVLGRARGLASGAYVLRLRHDGRHWNNATRGLCESGSRRADRLPSGPLNRPIRVTLIGAAMLV
jgi:chloramphenicol 3-O phosphotransferase